MKLQKFVIMIGVVLFLLGCGAGTGQKTGEYNFKQGISQLQHKFVENAPPAKIYQNSDFKIIIELDNQAAYDLHEGTVKLLGLNEKYFSLLPLEQPFETLLGRSLTSPEGDKRFIEFEGYAGQLIPGAEEYTANYYLTIRYRSAVEFADTVCLNPKPYEMYDAGCKVQAKKSYSGQGAPIAVTNMEEIISPGSGVEFRVFIKNRGQGKAQFLSLERAHLGGKELTCEFQQTGENKRIITLKKEKQEATLICKALFSAQNSYMTTLALDFNYNYEIKQQHKLKLIK